MDQPTHKKCSRCAEQKPLSEYGVHRATKDGLHYTCRNCLKAARDAWTPEQKRAKRMNNARFMAKARASRSEVDRQAMNEYLREWRKANPDYMPEYRRSYREAHGGTLSAVDAKYRAENPEIISESKRRRRATLLSASVGPVDLDALWTGECAICGHALDPDTPWPDPRSRSVDHIVPLAKGGSHSQENLQWTCLICNLRKGAKVP